MQLGKEAAALVTHQFPSPISLEFGRVLGGCIFLWQGPGGGGRVLEGCDRVGRVLGGTPRTLR